MASTGPSPYDDAFISKYGAPYEVPLIIATEESFKDFGRPVHCFEDEEVWITRWPQEGWRPICPGTGDRGGVRLNEFQIEWEGDRVKDLNRDATIGRLPVGAADGCHDYVLACEANYHPDSGQVFFPKRGEPFVLLAALPGEDVKLEDFVAFYIDGSFGVQIKPYIWHQAAYPFLDRVSVLDKQGRVHANVMVNTVEEFGKFLKIPLNPRLAVSA